MKPATAASFSAFVIGFSSSEVLQRPNSPDPFGISKRPPFVAITPEMGEEEAEMADIQLPTAYKNPLGHVLIDDCHAFFTSQGCLPGSGHT